MNNRRWVFRFRWPEPDGSLRTIEVDRPTLDQAISLAKDFALQVWGIGDLPASATIMEDVRPR